MTLCQCEGIESKFDRAYAAEKLEAYRRSGPDPTTRALLDALLADGVAGATLLDIGGGVGVVQHELLKAGLAGAVEVEASSAYAEACRAEAERQGHSERIRHLVGEFGALAEEVEPADIVTLDRSVCCWPDMREMVARSATKARRLYGIVYPRDTLWVRYGWRAWSRARLLFHRNPMRVFVHRSSEVEAILREQGLERRSCRRMGVWQVVVFARVAPS